LDFKVKDLWKKYAPLSLIFITKKRAKPGYKKIHFIFSLLMK